MNLFKRSNTKIILFAFAVTLTAGFVAFISNYSPVNAEGVYSHIGTTNGSAGGYDAVSWSQGYPIMIDSYGKIIVFTQQNGTGVLDLTFSNDEGATWSEIASSSTNRTGAVYDPINDKIHTVSTDTIGGLLNYRRYVIRRDRDYNIVTIELEPGTTALIMEDSTGCSAGETRNPIVLWKNTGADGTIVAFWSVEKTCSAVTTTETRASMRILSDSTADFTANNWAALNGVSDEGGANGPALIDYNEMYVYAGDDTIFQHSAMIAEGGTNNEDIYYFNIDENDTHGFRRLNWSGGNWAGAWTTRTTFGGNVDDSQGYNLKKELLTKPVLATAQDRVYVGIARWGGPGVGDTQSLFSVAPNDSITLVQDLYSGVVGHCLYPTLDIAYDATEDELYSFYLTSGLGGDCGDVYYKTYDGTTMSTPTGFWTTPTQSVDIPIVYQHRWDDKLHLFYRVNSAIDPNTPPHDIYYGYLPLSATPVTLPTPIVASGGTYTANDYGDFNQTCAIYDGVKATNRLGVGAISRIGVSNDDFDTPVAPYPLLFRDLWTSNVFTSGIFDPRPNGSVNVTNPANGAYAQGVSTYGPGRTMTFRGRFNAANFQHIGFVDSSSFNQYIMFSTGGDATLRARVSDGSETAVSIGTSPLGLDLTYVINWQPGSVVFTIEGITVATISTNIPAGTLRPFLSNNATGSSLLLDYILFDDYIADSGTYQSCSIDSGVANTSWTDVTTIRTVPGGTTTTLQTRTSNDGVTWSAWSADAIGSGVSGSPAGRYLQYLFTATSTTTATPALTSVEFDYNRPPASPINLGDTSVTTGGAIVTVTPTFSFELSDPELSNVGYQIQIDDSADFGSPIIDYASASAAAGTFSFTVGQAVGGGTYNIGSAATVLVDGTSYYWRVRAFDTAPLYSPYVAANGGAIAFSVGIPVTTTTTTTTSTSSESTSSSSSTTSSASGGAGSTSSSGSTTSGAAACSVSKPSQPTITATTVINDNQISLTIDKKGAVIDNYVVEYGMASGSYIYNKKEVDASLGDVIVIKGLTPDTRYYFRVQSVDDCAGSEWSEETNARTNPLDVSVGETSSQTTTTSGSGGSVSGIDWNQVGLLCILPLVVILLGAFFLITKRKKDEEDGRSF